MIAEKRKLSFSFLKFEIHDVLPVREATDDA